MGSLNTECELGQRLRIGEWDQKREQRENPGQQRQTANTELDGRGELQRRDLEVLRLCYEHQFLIHEHVESLFASHRSIPYRRLSRLVDMGFLERQYHPILGSSRLIRLTNLGLQTALHHAPIRVSQLRNLTPTTLIHDALVTSARLRLAQFWNASFVPERAIKTSSFPIIPDGIFYFPSGRGVALEVENSDKGRFRFQKLLARWKNHPSIAAVLYVASNAQLYRILQSYLTEAQWIKEPLLCLVLWDDLKRGQPLVKTQFTEANLFSNKEVF